MTTLNPTEFEMKQEKLQTYAKELLEKAEKATPTGWDIMGGNLSPVGKWEVLTNGIKISAQTEDSDTQYIAACSPSDLIPLLQTFLAQSEALREAEAALINCDKVFRVVENVGRESYCYADFRPEHVATKTWLAKYAKGEG